MTDKELLELAAKAELHPAYPKGQVIGSCVCGSWPGGECLKCKWMPTPTPRAAEIGRVSQ